MCVCQQRQKLAYLIPAAMRASDGALCPHLARGERVVSDAVGGGALEDSALERHLQYHMGPCIQTKPAAAVGPAQSAKAQQPAETESSGGARAMQPRHRFTASDGNILQNATRIPGHQTRSPRLLHPARSRCCGRHADGRAGCELRERAQLTHFAPSRSHTISFLTWA